MRIPKFKVGDKVKVLRASTEAEHDLWMDSWVRCMNKCVGKILTIGVVLNKEDSYISYKYYLNEMGLNFPEFVLRKHPEVGRQLLFSFMD